MLEAKSQLNNTKVYEKWNSNPLQKVNTEIKSVLIGMLNRKEINKEIMEYLLIKRPQLGRFYLLPKIHKQTSNVPGRPVIANNGTATENISAFLDFHPKPIAPTVPHILEGIRDFLSRLNENAYLVSFMLLGCTYIYLTRRSQRY